MTGNKKFYLYGMKKLVFLLVTLIAMGCNETVAPRPDKLIEQDKMENILYDVALLQAIKSFKPEVLDTNGVDPRTYIYKKYDIDSLTLAQNHTWYAADLEEYEIMQQKVADRLKAESDKLKVTKKPAAKPKKTATTAATPAANPGRERMMQKRKELEQRQKLQQR